LLLHARERTGAMFCILNKQYKCASFCFPDFLRLFTESFFDLFLTFVRPNLEQPIGIYNFDISSKS
ncbi:MAG: hypothetical protein V2I33_23030, partial [Kangiellaceae bacterium]|nr:hypothetical protein [Kangiellaceae bacterium]